MNGNMWCIRNSVAYLRTRLHHFHRAVDTVTAETFIVTTWRAFPACIQRTVAPQ